jgi:hypothetical protein
MFNGWLKKFLGTLYAILYKIKRTDFWGQIEPTYLQNGLRLQNFKTSKDCGCKCVYNEKKQRSLSCI